MSPKSTPSIRRRASLPMIAAAVAMLLTAGSGSLNAAPPKPPIELEAAGLTGPHRVVRIDC